MSLNETFLLVSIIHTSYPAYGSVIAAVNQLSRTACLFGARARCLISSHRPNTKLRLEITSGGTLVVLVQLCRVVESHIALHISPAEKEIMVC